MRVIDADKLIAEIEALAEARSARLRKERVASGVDSAWSAEHAAMAESIRMLNDLAACVDDAAVESAPDIADLDPEDLGEYLGGL